MQGNDININVTVMKLRMAAFWDNVVTAAFPDNVVPVMSPLLTDGGISGYTVVPVMSSFFTDGGISG
jgi:hypothetical protein